MNTTGVRVVLDTNILIAIIGKKSPFRWVFNKVISGDLILCISNEILLEYREILEQKNGIEVAENVSDFIAVHPFVERVDIFFNFHLIAPDRDDDKFVDCAIAAGAHCIVSNDHHFRILKTIDFPKVQVLTLQEFEVKFKDE